MKRIIALCLITLALDAGAAPEVEPGMAPCPEQFPVETIKLSPVAKGWVAIAPSVVPLTSVDLMFGPPREPGKRLIGQKRKMRDGFDVTFEVSKPDPDGKWMVCHYGDLALAQRLPDETDRCIVSYYRRPAYNNYDIQVACHTAPPAVTAAKRRQ